MEEATGLVSQIKAVILGADLNKFNWELTDRDQVNFDVKMMTFLWFNENVTPHERHRVQLDIQQALARTPVEIKGDIVRATLETASDRRPWNKAQAIFLCTMSENPGLTKAKFDIGWVSTGIRVSVNSALPDRLCPYWHKLLPS